jgi:cysteine-rich repeat protein
LSYPFWHKIYLNSLPGFGSLTGPQLALAQCEADPGIISTALVDNSLLPLGLSDPNGGNPYCEDFDEQVRCGQSSNANACAGNGAVHMPTASTTCGDGIVEAYEECDNGTANANGGPVGTCSLICRFN